MNFSSRIHPLSMAVAFLQTLGRMVWLIVLAFFLRFSRGESSSGLPIELMITALGGLSVFGSLMMYLTTKFGVENGQLFVVRGFIGKSDRRIPLDRVQNVDVIRDAIPRMLGLARLKVDTGAGGEGSEVSIQYLKLDEAEHLSRVLLQRGGEVSQIPEERPVWSISLQELLLAGVGENRAFVLGVALFGFLAESRRFGVDLEKLISGAINTKRGLSEQNVVLGSLLFLVLLLVGWLVSIGQMVLKYYNFRVFVSSDRLVRIYGLLNERRNALAIRRVQTVEVRTGFFRRLLGLWEVRAHTCARAGHSRDERDEPEVHHEFVPVVAKEHLADCVALAMPGFNYSQVRWTRVSPKAWVRKSIEFAGSLLTLALLPSALDRGRWPIYVCAALFIGIGAALWYGANAAYAVHQNALIVRSGVSKLRVIILPFTKLQSAAVRSDFLDRLFRFANVSATSAGASSALHCLDQPEAERLYDLLCNAAAQSGDWSPDGV